MINKNTIAILLAARSGSKRLPNKHFLKIHKNLNIIDICILRLKKVTLVNKIFLCTTKKNIDDKDLNKSLNTFKQKIALYACEINRAFAFAKLIRQKYKIKNKILIETSIFNYKVYKTMKELNLLDKNIDIVPEVRNISKIYYYFKNIFFFLKILVFLEINFFKNNFFKKNIIKKKKLF